MSASDGAEGAPGPEDDGDEQPMLSLDEIVMQEIASNDEWAFRQADMLQKRMPARVGGPDRRTEAEVFDRLTLLTLHKFLVHGVLKSLDFPVATGKEANVFRGTTPRGGFVAVKIYRINTATFKHVLQYIQGDERFEGVTGDKRALVHAWCQKEYRNLARLRDVGVPVPEPIKASANVLVTEYLGTKQGPWPRLQELRDLPDPQRLYDQLVEDYLKAYNKADLIHADLSEYNVLVADVDKDPSVWRARTIDVGQAVLKSHPMAPEFIERDLRNLTNFFRRRGVDADPMAIRARLVHERARDSEPKALAGRGRRARRPFGGEEE